MLKGIGVALIVLGVLGLAYGGFTYVKDRDSADLGPVEIAVEEKETVPIPPILGIVGVLVGTALILTGNRKQTT